MRKGPALNVRGPFSYRQTLLDERGRADRCDIAVVLQVP